MSLIIRARTEEGETLSDRELRDELMTLVLAGHETTANQLAWAWERLVRSPEAHERLIESVRSGSEDADDVVEATITEAMRSRPVIPMTGRRVTVHGDSVPTGSPPAPPSASASCCFTIARTSIPSRWRSSPSAGSGRRRAANRAAGRRAGIKPGTYEWIPFGGGTRRCLGAALAMAEQRVVLSSMARRLDIEAVDPRAERPRHRNVTMIPAHGGRVIVRGRR